MHSFFNLKSAAIRRLVLLLFSPILLFLFFICRISSAIRGIAPDFHDAFMGIWDGVKKEDEVLPCPFCGGKCNPDGWMSQSGASGPCCEGCGATAYNGDSWNRRIKQRGID